MFQRIRRRPLAARRAVAEQNFHGNARLHRCGLGGVRLQNILPGGGPPTDTIGLGVSFPLPIWNQNKGNIDAAKAGVEQSRIALEKLRAQAAGDLVNAEIFQREAAARAQRYREEIRSRSASARASVIFKFEKGGASLVDLLQAERTDNDVRIATAQAMADAISAAADLLSAQTALTETKLSAVK